MDVYDKIVRTAREKGIPITVLESSCGMSRSAISKWKSHSPTLDNLERVANGLGVTVSALLDDSPERKEAVSNGTINRNPV